MTERFGRVLLAGLLLTGGLTAASINLVGNGSFENNVVSPGATQSNSYVNGSTWQVFAAVDRWGIGYPSYGVELQKNNLYGVPSNTASGNNAWDGSQWAELDYNVGNLLIGQTATPQIYQDIINTTPGATYLLSFYYTARPDGGTQQLGVFWGDASAAAPALFGTTASRTGTNSLQWVPVEFRLVATGTSMRVGLGSLANAAGVNFAGGNLLDLVSLSIVEGTSVTGAVTVPGTTTGGTTVDPGTTTSGTTTSGTTTSGTTTGGTTTGGTTTGGGTTISGTTISGTTIVGTTFGGSTTGGTTTGGTTSGVGVGDVPEPGTYAMMGMGVAALLIARKRRG